ncbi:hypothetical protein FVEN_g5076 [Fusarium venenatum]|uniref:DUF3500 domain-containing protein n=1 Tax=Fusarium venenatum TaxID=56646 RepID=A0A2L2SXC8_9HYPO|nr:uncharacterized protein FVRRES_06970 [Fusarium venenatum]KAG8357043.1 hypothetical protein FVEN_g5076 [Fusarium venenatum]KAH6993928.1 hypothetical protein EDB82DRAFT_178712 [Fusarium venenatum]CEI62534.1 unnamed protein product [Fusarium venenatum]
MSQSGHVEGFRQYLPDLNQPRFQDMKKQDAYEYAENFKKGGNPPWLYGLYLHWRKLFNEPYQGVTSDGAVRDGLFELQHESIPIESIVEAANSLCNSLSEEQKDKTFYHIDSPEWRSWSNPEFLLSDKGIRLDEVTNDLRAKVLKVLELTLSPEGYEKAIGAMRVNHFLGELVESPSIMNEFSYNFALFGEPSTTRPWGFSFYGHHLCLNIFLYKSQIVVSPWFTGAEPNLIDDGPYKGTRILHREEDLGLRLMQSLSPDQQKAAQVYELMKDPAMSYARWNHDDQRHLCGAYRDNRIVPYEGILVSEMTAEQQKYILDIANEFLLYLPSTAREIRLEQFKKWFHETYFCWIGGYNNEDPFYYRIQSPVVIFEFDHHSGVFLNNQEPAKFHIHTLMRTPNRGDYGMALRPLIPGVEQKYLWEG